MDIQHNDISPEEFEVNELTTDAIPAWMRDRDGDLWVDNKVAHDAICQTFANLIERLAACENAIVAHHKHLESQPPIDANLFMYKPKGEKDHLNIGKNLDLIYQRLVELEAMAHKAPRTNHGERLTALEEKINGL